MKKAICLLSGGLDSTVCLYVARSEGYQVIALSIEYGQRHFREISAARALTKALVIPHYFSALSMPWKGSALLDPKIKLPKNRDEKVMAGEIPPTYVPGRNSVFLSMAMSCAETENADAIFIGANALDYSGYPDCRPEYLEAVSAAMWRGTKAGVEGRKVAIKAPLINLSKKDIVLLGQKLGVPFHQTWSCYAGDDTPCGTCDSCILRAKGFHAAGIADPLLVDGKEFGEAPAARISEIFSSIQGEGLTAGEKHLFIRFEECFLQCDYCDEAGKTGKLMTLSETLREVEELERAEGPHDRVSLTGGEPLLQSDFLRPLCRELKSRGFRIMLETNGILWRALPEVLGYCDEIAMDLKLSSVTLGKGFLEEHRQFLKAAAEKPVHIKIVVSEDIDVADYEAHLKMVADTAPHVPVFLQPVTDQEKDGGRGVRPETLEKLLQLGRQRLPDVRVGARLHKMLNIR